MTAPSPGGVQRYFLDGQDAGTIEDRYGDWVRYGDHVEVVKRLTEDADGMASDHTELCRELEQSIAEADRLRKALEHLMHCAGYFAHERGKTEEQNIFWAVHEGREALRGAAGEASK